jgi:hypothetical protein
MVIIGGLINLTSCVSEYFYPSIYYGYAYPAVDSVKEDVNVSSEAVATNTYYPYDYDYYTQQTKNSKIRSLRDIFTSIVTVGVATVLYAFHWGLVQKEREQV